MTGIPTHVIISSFLPADFAGVCATQITLFPFLLFLFINRSGLLRETVRLLRVLRFSNVKFGRFVFVFPDTHLAFVKGLFQKCLFLFLFLKVVILDSILFFRFRIGLVNLFDF